MRCFQRTCRGGSRPFRFWFRLNDLQYRESILQAVILCASRGRHEAALSQLEAERSCDSELVLSATSLDNADRRALGKPSLPSSNIHSRRTHDLCPESAPSYHSSVACLSPGSLPTHSHPQPEKFTSSSTESRIDMTAPLWPNS